MSACDDEPQPTAILDPIATPTSEATSGVPVPTPTSTPVPRPTSTPSPRPTNTPSPTPTSTPLPTSSSTSCRLVKRSAGWDVEGFALDSNRDVGRSLGRKHWRPDLSFDWGRGQVFGDRKDMLLLDATMPIVVHRPEWVWFEIGGDDGFGLYIDDEVVLADWNNGFFRSFGKYIWMQPGMHELRLKYYEWTDRAELLFRTSPDVLTWYQAVGCDRSDQARLSASSPSPVVFDGTLLPGIHHSQKVVVLQGIDSKISCEDVRRGRELLRTQRWRNGVPDQPWSESLSTPAPTPDLYSMFWRRHSLVKFLQDRIAGDWEGNVLGFSYSGKYENCITGKLSSGEAYPFGDYRVFPRYDPMDTCGGVRNAATKLSSLLTSLHDREPNREIVLIGHSLGGMVAAYYVVEVAPPEIRSRITSIVTIDSPLQGHDFRNPLSVCPEVAQSWQDIRGRTEIVRSVNSIQSTDLAKKFVHLNSTAIGGYLAGAHHLRLECAEVSKILGVLIGLVLTGGLDHSCGFYDPVALEEIVDTVRH